MRGESERQAEQQKPSGHEAGHLALRRRKPQMFLSVGVIGQQFELPAQDPDRFYLERTVMTGQMTPASTPGAAHQETISGTAASADV